MALSNYGELKAALNSYLEQEDTQSMIDTFIRLCEARVNRELVVRWMRKTMTGSIDSQVVALPSDFNEPITLRLLGTTPYSRATRMDPDAFFDLAIASQSGGPPRIYTVLGTDMYFAPDPGTPDPGTWPYRLEYYADVPPLGTTNTTNWLLTKAPDVYLYGTLLEAQPFLADDDRAKTWESFYSRAINSLSGVSIRGKSRPITLMRSTAAYYDGKGGVR